VKTNKRENTRSLSRARIAMPLHIEKCYKMCMAVRLQLGTAAKKSCVNKLHERVITRSKYTKQFPKPYRPQVRMFSITMMF